jgi:hypothetical protein
MTNHPTRGYRSLIFKLQRLGVSSKVAPDARRLAMDACSTMITAERYPRHLMSDASYRNLHGEDAMQRMREDKAALEAERASNMERARNTAERFLSVWNL